MRIQSVTNSTSFGKIPVLQCRVEEASSGNINKATLYKMEPNKPEDAREIKYSKNARCIYYDFMVDAGKHISDRDYYLLQNNKTKEVIACAQASRHFRPDNAEFNGMTTFIEEMSENPKYVKGGLPIFAHIALNSLESNDASVSTSTYTSAIDSLAGSSFIQIDTGDWILPKDDYRSFIKQVMYDSSLDYVENLDTVG